MRVSSDIQRRLLVNYRADPEVIAPLLPAGLRPQLVNGWALVGICLIRLGDVRPYRLPAAVGITTENAAHRIAVEWDSSDGLRPAVYIPRRDTASALTVLVGGRAFPGTHQRARFDVEESEDRVRVAYTSSDGTVDVDAEVTVAENLNNSRMFRDLEHASSVFRAAPVALSPRRDGRLEAVELGTEAWAIEPAELVRVTSSFWDDVTRFPAGSVVLDSALLMRGVPATWTSASPPGSATGARCRTWPPASVR
jgi:Uncharacterized conserved protein (COG2071)